ncbi:MAG: ATP-binding protein [Nanoarchaeota archaeon]|nr:ATP-binding protein [Nanoarchaeota archaeon]
MDEQTRQALEKQNPWWFNKEFEAGIDRLGHYNSLLKYLAAPEILLLVGPRRTGKSTLLYQLIRHILQKEPADSILFVNLDEPLFESRSKDPAFLSGIIGEYAAQKKLKYLFIDEVQSYEHWAQAIKTLYDTEKGIKIILTGSSSILINSVISSRLSGRYFHVIVYPLSFQECLKFNGIARPSILEKKRHFEQYLKYGAFPRVVLEKDSRLKHDLLKSYFQTILLKDIIYPNKLRNNRDIFDLVYFIVSNVGKPVSFNSLARLLNISVDTAKEYMHFAEETYLLLSIAKYDCSVKKQIINPRKSYCIDTGLVNSLSFRFSENRGRLLENLAFVSLSRTGEEIYYHKDKLECDFLVKKGNKISQAIQVSVSLKDKQVKTREQKGLLEAMEAHGLKKGLILTEEETGELKVKGKTIIIKPLYEWLLE